MYYNLPKENCQYWKFQNPGHGPDISFLPLSMSLTSTRLFIQIPPRVKCLILKPAQTLKDLDTYLGRLPPLLGQVIDSHDIIVRQDIIIRKLRECGVSSSRLRFGSRVLLQLFAPRGRYLRNKLLISSTR
jgi:hypothetical protein